MAKDILLDFDRQSRTGIGEAIFCLGKSVDQLRSICDALSTDKRMLFSRLSVEQFQALETSHSGLLSYDPVSRTAFTGEAKEITPSSVAILTGGSSDVPVAREASKTLEFYGHGCQQFDDIGVAGLWRLLGRVDEIRDNKIVIAIAGMDAALPTVLGGLVGSSIIAVPTSVGYGAARGGETALSALLASCASGITVTNIDNGFGAACAAIRILNQFSYKSD